MPDNAENAVRREGQSRVEVRPGAFIWMDANDKKAFEQRQAAAQSEAPVSLPKASVPEAAAIEPVEDASQQPKARKK